jgi:cytochrome c-type biogenesis protein
MLNSFLDGVGKIALTWVEGHPLGWWSPLLAFVLGLLNTLNPCTISILPLWGLYLFGQVDSSQEKTFPSQLSQRLHVSLLFTTGMVLALSILAFLALQLRLWVFGAWNQPWIWVLTGIFTILLGLSILLKWTPWQGLQGKTQGLFQLSQHQWFKTLKPLVLGISFALILSPCSTPFLLALTLILLQSPHPAISFLSIVFYSVGQGVLFLLLPLLLPWIQQRLQGVWLNRLQALSGVILVLLGVWLSLYPTF